MQHDFVNIKSDFLEFVDFLEISVDFFSHSVNFQKKRVVFCDMYVFLHKNMNI